jgi:UDP-3-O-[3-hydroxymyristoyl] glucosamine N-acyltransferase
MTQTVGVLAEKLGCRVLGDPSVVVAKVASITSATPESLIFIDDLKNLEQALASSAAAIIAGEFASHTAATKPLLISAQPRLTFARAAKLLQDAGNQPGVIHSSAIVPASTRVGKNVAIGPRAVLGEDVVVGDGTTIGTGCSLGDAVEIGAHCRLDANVTIYAGTTVGDRVIVQAGAVLGSEGFGYIRDAETGRYEQFPQVGRLIIEDDVDVGANSTIDRGALDETRIRRGAKIDNLVHVGHNVQIGQDVVIAAQTGLSGSVVVEDNVIMGGQVGIGDHAYIEAGAILGAQSGVLSKKIVRGAGVVFWGTPARPLREYLKELAYLSRAARKGHD